MAATGAAPTNREVVADEFAATFGENRRAAGETCALLLAVPGGRTSEPAAVRSDAGPNRAVAGTDGITIGGGQVGSKIVYSGLWGQGQVLQKWAINRAISSRLVQNAYRFRALPMKIVPQRRERARWAYNGAVVVVKKEIPAETVSEEYLKKHNITRGRVLIGLDEQLQRSLNLHATPETALVQDGIVEKTWAGVLSNSDLNEIEVALRGNRR